MISRRIFQRVGLLLMIGALALTACASAPPSTLELGKSALRDGDVNKAIENLEKAITDEPGSAEAHLTLGQAYVRNKRNDDAQKQFEAAFTLDAATPMSITAASAEEPFLMGNAHAGLNQLEQAKAAYEEALKLDPKKSAAYTNLGVVYYQQGKFADAVTQLKQALDIDPQDAETYYMLGATYVQQSNLSEAEKAFQQALTLKPELGQAYIGLGNVYLMNKQYDQAVTTLQKATELQPDLPEGWLALGQVYVAQGDAANAKSALDKCLQLSQPGTGLYEKCQSVQQQSGAP